MQEEHLEGLVEAAVRLQEGGRTGVAGHGRATQLEEGGQERLPHLEAQGAPIPGEAVEAAHQAPVQDDVLFQNGLLGAGGARRPAVQQAGDQREESKRCQRQRRHPDPHPRGTRASPEHLPSEEL